MPLLNAKIAIQIAKNYVADIFGEEGAYNIGLEEIVFRPDAGIWEVTIGFSRPWDKHVFGAAIVTRPEGRSYKVVDVNDVTSQVDAVRDRPTQKGLG